MQLYTVLEKGSRDSIPSFTVNSFRDYIILGFTEHVEEIPLASTLKIVLMHVVFVICGKLTMTHCCVEKSNSFNMEITISYTL